MGHDNKGKEGKGDRVGHDNKGKEKETEWDMTIKGRKRRQSGT